MNGFSPRMKGGDMKSRPEEDSPCSSDDGDQLTLSRVRQRSLVDAMEDEESPVAPKRHRRMSISDALIGGFHSLRHNGSQLTALVGDTLGSFAKTKTREPSRGLVSNNDESKSRAIDMRSTPQEDYISVNHPLTHSSLMDLLKEKTAHGILLQQELAQIKSQNAQLHIEKTELKDSERRIASRMKVMKRSVHDASESIVMARKEADEAKATSSNLAAKLHKLQEVVQETKDASQTLVQERDSLYQQVHSVERRYMESQAALAKSITQQNNTRQRNDDLIRSVESLQGKLEGLNSSIEELKNETTRWKTISSNLKMQDTLNQNRIKCLEEQLKNMGSLLQDPSTKAEEPKSQTGATNEDVPPRDPNHADKENGVPTVKCSICYKDAFGLMRKCQCGQTECNFHAHNSCLNRVTAGPSVSHPGTPAPRLPIILCSSMKLPTAPSRKSVECHPKI